MTVSRPPELLAAGVVAGLAALAFNVRGPVSVPCWAAAVLRRASRSALVCAWMMVFALVPPATPIRANDRAPVTEQPNVTSVETPSGEVTRLDGSAAPGDRIIIRVNGRHTAETSADTNGRWRLQLPERLSPGDHTVTVVAVAPGSVRVKVSGEVRISIPQPAIPQYAAHEAELRENPSSSEEALPNDATRKLAAQLARDASSEFSKLTAPEPDAEEATPPAAEPAGQVADSETPEAFVFRDLLRPDRWLEAIAAWLARSSHDYNEILVTGLSNPERRLHRGAAPDEIPSGAIPPLPARPEQEPSRIGNFLTTAAAWLQQASRDYHQYIVQELALRGIEDPQQRQAAREAASTKQTASPTGEGVPTSEPTRPQLDRARDEERIAEARRREIGEANRQKEERAAEARRRADERAVEERRAAEKLRADEERQEAEERARRRAAEEEKARARQLQEAQRREREQQRQRELEKKQAEEKSIASALEQQLKQRDQQSRPARREQQELAPAPATPRGAKPEPQQAPTETAAKPKPNRPGTPGSASAKSGGTLAKIRPPTRMSDAEQTGPVIDPPSRNERRIAKLPKAVAHPPLPSRVWAKLRDPPLPARSLRIMADPPLPERRKRPATIAASETARRAGLVSQARRMALPVRRPHRRSVKNRHRGCKDPAAGRAIRTPGTYIVTYGDTLWDIAERHYGAGHLYGRIQRANGRRMARANRIYPCQRLWLPRLGRHQR